MAEFINNRAATAETADPLVSPVTVQEAVDWLALPASDSIIPALLLSATDAVINYIGKDLLPREWVATYWDWPATGTFHARNVGRDTGNNARLISLPYAQLISVQAVTVYGEAATEFVARKDAIVIDGYAADGQNQDPALVIEYTAGFENVPEAIRQAILAYVGFTYEHRGSCEAADAMKRSGAAELLAPWRKGELFI